MAAAAAGDTPLAAGLAVLQAALRTLPAGPGVYRMQNAAGDVLYVGKARALKRRVASYTQPARLPVRLLRMVAETRSLEIVTTGSDVEALLLESNLIKRLKPRYNVLLRDDKSYPDILITSDHACPRLMKHRGRRTQPGHYFGPFASGGAVNRTLTALHKAFLLRPCSDAVFRSRSRPCLQYQIKRCAAPCVGRVDEAEYARLVGEALDFLAGRSQTVQETLAQRMQDASDRLDFETAAVYRDRIRALAVIQAHQDINVQGIGDSDVVALHQEGGQSVVQVFFFRDGRNYGNRPFYPSHEKGMAPGAVMAAFLGQFYEDKIPPPLLLVSETPTEADWLVEALSVRAGRRVRLVQPQRGDKRQLVEHALVNAREALGRRLAESASQRRLLEGMAQLFDLEPPLQRVEVYDNSHIQGTHAVGAMIVAGPDGFMRAAYRKFTIKNPEAAGDDTAMMREVLDRRFSRALREDPERSAGTWPDLVLIDGGAGQLSAACTVLAELGLEDQPVVAVAKGPERNAGRERFFRPGHPPLSLEPGDPVLYFLQRLRDEAHRFAIETHRARRSKGLVRSALDEIDGVGAKRKKALLLHFGSARAVMQAGLKDLETVDGISRSIARKIYDHFHKDG